MSDREELLRDALEHIAKTAGMSRTSTRRLRWIEERAKLALKGKPYVEADLDLPYRNANSAANLQVDGKRYRFMRDPDTDISGCFTGQYNEELLSGEELDAAVDAARLAARDPVPAPYEPVEVERTT